MKEIKNVAIIGLGALGVLYGSALIKALGKEHVRIIADKERQKRYEAEGVFANGERIEPNFIAPQEKPACPCDLFLISVKAGGLKQAILDAKNVVGEDTVIISIINGVTSEQIIGEAFGKEKVLYCVSQSSGVRVGRSVTFKNRGALVLGYLKGEEEKEPALKAVMDCFAKAGIPIHHAQDALHALYSKWIVNVGVNQTVAYLAGNYATVQEDGPARAMMLEAMLEAKAVANAEGVPVTDKDVEYYFNIVDALPPEAMPSMRQDTLAGRKTEVELFSETVLAKAKKFGIKTPVNEKFYAFFTGKA